MNCGNILGHDFPQLLMELMSLFLRDMWDVKSDEMEAVLLCFAYNHNSWINIQEDITSIISFCLIYVKFVLFCMADRHADVTHCCTMRATILQLAASFVLYWWTSILGTTSMSSSANALTSFSASSTSESLQIAVVATCASFLPDLQALNKALIIDLHLPSLSTVDSAKYLLSLGWICYIHNVVSNNIPSNFISAC